MAAVRASISILERLREGLNDDEIIKQNLTQLRLALDRLQGNLASAETLRHRVGGIIQLVRKPDVRSLNGAVQLTRYSFFSSEML